MSSGSQTRQQVIKFENGKQSPIFKFHYLRPPFFEKLQRSRFQKGIA